MAIGYDNDRCDEVAVWIKHRGRAYVAWNEDPVRVLEYMDRLYETANKTAEDDHRPRRIHTGEFEFLVQALALRAANDTARKTRNLVIATWGLFVATIALGVVAWITAASGS